MASDCVVYLQTKAKEMNLATEIGSHSCRTVKLSYMAPTLSGDRNADMKTLTYQTENLDGGFLERAACQTVPNSRLWLSLRDQALRNEVRCFGERPPGQCELTDLRSTHAKQTSGLLTAWKINKYLNGSRELHRVSDYDILTSHGLVIEIDA